MFLPEQIGSGAAIARINTFTINSLLDFSPTMAKIAKLMRVDEASIANRRELWIPIERLLKGGGVSNSLLRPERES